MESIRVSFCQPQGSSFNTISTCMTTNLTLSHCILMSGSVFFEKSMIPIPVLQVNIIRLLCARVFVIAADS